jgi:hypothetical protein
MSVKTFFEHVWDWLKAEAPHASSWESAALTALKVSAPLLNTLITLTAGAPIAAKVAGVVSQAQADIAGAAATISTAGAATGGLTISSFLGSVQANLGTLLTDADVKNATEFTKIESTINTVVGEVQAITSLMPAATAPAPAPPAA